MTEKTAVTADVLTTLIERVEQGSGPDRELDCYVLALVEERDIRVHHSKEFGRQLLARSRKPPHDEFWIDHPAYDVPAFTDSVAAAVALTEKLGFKIEQINEAHDGKSYWAKAGQDRRMPAQGGNCSSMARSILSAALSALLATMEGE